MSHGDLRPRAGRDASLGAIRLTASSAGAATASSEAESETEWAPALTLEEAQYDAAEDNEFKKRRAVFITRKPVGGREQDSHAAADARPKSKWDSSGDEADAIFLTPSAPAPPKTVKSSLFSNDDDNNNNHHHSSVVEPVPVWLASRPSTEGHSSGPATGAYGGFSAGPATGAYGGFSAGPATEAYGSFNAGPATEAYGSFNAGPATEAYGSFNAGPATEAYGSFNVGAATEAYGSPSTREVDGLFGGSGGAAAEAYGSFDASPSESPLFESPSPAARLSLLSQKRRPRRSAVDEDESPPEFLRQQEYVTETRAAASSSPSGERTAEPEDGFEYPNDGHDGLVMVAGEPGKYDWNLRYQRLVDTMAEQRARGYDAVTAAEQAAVNRAMLHLSQDFVHSATTFGKIIIAEVFLDVAQKTIKPRNLGGAAGGEKYIVQNILFKFAVDSHGLFGSSLLAAKVAGHELKGAMAYFSLCMPDVYTPLMALVDYRGFRLICMAILPLQHGDGRSSLVYGSEDGGRTVIASDRRFNKLMRVAAKSLNLKPHLCGQDAERLQWLNAACDVEGHLGSDGKFYMLDFSRTMPPVKPDPRVHNGHLYQLFRKEFVASLPFPLCPDAYSGFVRHDPDARRYNEDIARATDIMLAQHIPRFAKDLVFSVREAETQSQLSKFNVTAVFHKNSINLRYIGVVHACLPCLPETENTRRLLLLEAVARDLKNRLRLRLQNKMAQLRVPLEVPYRQLVIDFFNLAFSSSSISGEFIKASAPRLVKYFHFNETVYALLEGPLNVFFKSSVDPRFQGRWLLFKLLRKMTGLRFHDAAVQRFRGKGRWNSHQPLDILDLIEIGERVKHLSIVDAAEAAFFYHRGMQLANAGSSELAVDMFDRAVKKYDVALLTSPVDAELLFAAAIARFKLLEQRCKRQRRPSTASAQIYFDAKLQTAIEADFCFQRAINQRPREKYMLVTYAQFLLASQRYQRAEDFFLRALEVDGDYPLGLLHYGNFLIRRGEIISGNLMLHLAAGQNTDVSHDDSSCRLRVYLQDGTFKTIQARPSTCVPELKKEVIRSILTRMNNVSLYDPQQVLAMQQLYKSYDIYETDDKTGTERIMTAAEYPWYILQRPGNTSRLRFLPNVEVKDAALVKSTLNWGFASYMELLQHLELLQHPFSGITINADSDSISKVTFFFPDVVAIIRPVWSSVRDSLTALVLADSRWGKRLRPTRKSSQTDFIVAHLLHTAQAVCSLYGVIQISCQSCNKNINQKVLLLHKQAMQTVVGYYVAKDKSARKQLVQFCSDSWRDIIEILAHIHVQHLETLQVFHCDKILIFIVLYLNFLLTDHHPHVSKPVALTWLQPFDSHIPDPPVPNTSASCQVDSKLGAVRHRINYLRQLSALTLNLHGDGRSAPGLQRSMSDPLLHLSRFYLECGTTVKQKLVIRWATDMKRTICAECSAFLLPGRVRLRSKPFMCLKTTCFACGHVHRLPLQREHNELVPKKTRDRQRRIAKRQKRRRQRKLADATSNSAAASSQSVSRPSRSRQ